MSLVMFGGCKETVRKQLFCEHDWQGPCMGRIARYFKCDKCFAVEFDLPNNHESELKVLASRDS